MMWIQLVIGFSQSCAGNSGASLGNRCCDENGALNGIFADFSGIAL